SRSSLCGTVTAVSAGARAYLSWLQPRDREGGWAFCCEHATAVVDKDTKEAQSIAGEFNGFLKPKARLFAEPLRFATGELVLAAGYTPTIDADVLATHELGPRANSSREKH
ncbi:MAG TPA: hypothetical protein VFP38_19345, partial [Bradyrhizobium sp.]|nr:hypothetical protein [Bradyrhizobium sp.]